MDSSQKKRKAWSDAETQPLLQKATEMRIFRHIDWKKHKKQGLEWQSLYKRMFNVIRLETADWLTSGGKNLQWRKNQIRSPNGNVA